MRTLVTCGPSYEPIDQVRRITNFSTGRLGVLLASRLAREGFPVLCLKGVTASHPDPSPPVQVHHFTTNNHLLEQLRRASQDAEFTAVFHVAALSDFRLDHVEDPTGRTRNEGKIPSSAQHLILHLRPATKIIAELRTLFPRAWIVGWKYEVDGTRLSAIDRGRHQMQTHRTDACVVNGPACGTDFLLCQAHHDTRTCPDHTTLLDSLVAHLRERTSPT